MTSAEKIAFMHTFFGEDEQKRKCKECFHFDRYAVGNKVVRKCDVYGLSHSEATDWNANFLACGCINVETEFCNLYKTVSRSTMRVQIAGQVSMDI